MKKLFFLSLIIFIVVSCSDNTNKTDAPGIENNSNSLAGDSGDFFPVSSFLKGQMNLLDSMQVTFLQINTYGNKSDSVWLSREKVRPLLQPFIADEISNENLVSFFKESKFNDQSTDAITFTYVPKTVLPDSISLRRWDVYVNPETGSVKRIYILKQLNTDNQVYTQQLTWQTDKWVKIINILEKPDGSSEIQKEMQILLDLTGIK